MKTAPNPVFATEADEKKHIDKKVLVLSKLDKRYPTNNFAWASLITYSIMEPAAPTTAKTDENKDPTEKSTIPPWTAFLLPFLDRHTPQDNMYHADIYRGVTRQTWENVWLTKK